MRLPLAQLELTRTGRNKNTYRLRLVVPAFCAVVMFVAWGAMALGGSDAEEMAAFNSGLISKTVLVFQVFVAFLYTPLLASGMIAKEKQERTLGLLLLTSVKESDVLVAKGLSVFLQAELLLLGCLPLQAINSFFGGLTLDMMVGQQVTLAALCALVTCLGLLCSSISTRPMDALALTLGGEVVWLLVSAILDSRVLAPVGLSGAFAIETLSATFEPSFSWSIVSCFVAYSVFLAALSFFVARLALRRATDVRGSGRTLRHRNVASLSLFNFIPWLRLDPIGRIYAANVSAAGGVIYRWPWWLLTLVVSCIFGFPGAILFWLVIIVLIVNDVSSSLSSAQTEGSMDLLFATCADDNQLVRAIYRTHLRRAYLFLPPLFLANIYILDLQSMGSMGGLPESTPRAVQFAVIGALAFVETWIEASAYVCLACSSVTRYRHVGRQVIGAFTSLVGVHILVAFISIFVSVGVTVILDAGDLGRTALPNVLMPGNYISKAVYLVVLLAMSKSWLGAFRTAVEERWRVGETLDTRWASRPFPQATEPA